MIRLECNFVCNGMQWFVCTNHARNNCVQHSQTNASLFNQRKQMRIARHRCQNMLLSNWLWRNRWHRDSSAGQAGAQDIAATNTHIGGGPTAMGVSCGSCAALVGGIWIGGAAVCGGPSAWGGDPALCRGKRQTVSGSGSLRLRKPAGHRGG